MTKTIWVLVVHEYNEGFREPEKVFTSEIEAKVYSHRYEGGMEPLTPYLFPFDIEVDCDCHVDCTGDMPPECPCDATSGPIRA